MKRMPLAIIGLTLIILVAGVFLLSRSTDTLKNNPSTPYSSDTHLYYWSLTCFHCKNVADFMNTWSGKDKIKIEKKEVSENKDNASDLIQKGTTVCKLPQDQIGTIPLLITPDGKCIGGDTPVIGYFKSLNL